MTTVTMPRATAREHTPHTNVQHIHANTQEIGGDGQHTQAAPQAQHGLVIIVVILHRHGDGEGAAGDGRREAIQGIRLVFVQVRVCLELVREEGDVCDEQHDGGEAGEGEIRVARVALHTRCRRGEGERTVSEITKDADTAERKKAFCRGARCKKTSPIGQHSSECL